MLKVCQKCGGQVLSDGACLQCGKDISINKVDEKEIVANPESAIHRYKHESSQINKKVASLQGGRLVVCCSPMVESPLEPVVCARQAPGGKKPGRPNANHGARLPGSKYGRYY